MLNLAETNIFYKKSCIFAEYMLIRLILFRDKILLKDKHK